MKKILIGIFLGGGIVSCWSSEEGQTTKGPANGMERMANCMSSKEKDEIFKESAERWRENGPAIREALKLDDKRRKAEYKKKMEEIVKRLASSEPLTISAARREQDAVRRRQDVKGVSNLYKAYRNATPGMQEMYQKMFFEAFNELDEKHKVLFNEMDTNY